MSRFIFENVFKLRFIFRQMLFLIYFDYLLLREKPLIMPNHHEILLPLGTHRLSASHKVTVKLQYFNAFFFVWSKYLIRCRPVNNNGTWF